MSKLEVINGFRLPTPQEIDAVARYMQTYYTGQTKFARTARIVFLVLGVLLLLGGLARIKESTSAWVPAFVLGALCLVAAVSAGNYEKNVSEKGQRFAAGAFHVMDGTVDKKGINTRLPGICNVTFRTMQGDVLPGIHEVSQEDVEVGSPLLLVYIGKEESGWGKDFEWAFTPYMLTEEGIANAK